MRATSEVDFNTQRITRIIFCSKKQDIKATKSNLTTRIINQICAKGDNPKHEKIGCEISIGSVKKTQFETVLMSDQIIVFEGDFN